MVDPFLESRRMAHEIRQIVIRLATGGGCFLGASLSVVEILTYLYRHHLNVPFSEDRNRDYLLLSKGHDVPALYALFSRLGVLSEERLLRNHLKPSDDIYWHPNRNVRGVEFHSGSLGHLLSVGMGIAFDCRASGGNNRVVVVVGDGELNEGSIWEGMLVASKLRLDNLCVVVDRNQFQANGPTEEILPLEPLEDKFRAFGASVATVDGHDFGLLHDVFRQQPFQAKRVSVVIARTIRGKGLPSIEGKADKWFCNFQGSEITELLNELDGKTRAKLVSESLMVR